MQTALKQMKGLCKHRHQIIRLLKAVPFEGKLQQGSDRQSHSQNLAACIILHVWQAPGLRSYSIQQAFLAVSATGPAC